MANVTVTCRRCGGAEIQWPPEMSDDAKTLLAAKARGNRIEGVKFARSSLSLSLKGAKALVNHISDSGNRCHRCHRDVGPGESVCGQCNSANLNW